VSIRRVIAFMSFIFSVGLFIAGFFFNKFGWYAFLPGIVCIAVSVLLLLFTTWSDVTEIAKAIKK
jgi:hypothetical protein